jgi:hypothetical protein
VEHSVPLPLKANKGTRRNIMASLAEIRAKLLEQDSKSNGNNRSQGSGDNQIFTHWNINEGDTATLRFQTQTKAIRSFGKNVK